ncbi:PREDICTED: LOW QUALITY PROTEIN: uncharacterized protein LOC103592664 [Galeopterus variegatus]|uniref:Protein phosphatase 1 regulatory subunit 14 n=1 Tax=Galeopterus variegatus TaxID=482537 RepID=A0ABM0QZ97_GALVR|nr:PREDICTED: LOW QUALITY PROTEIN: uncharacterized protein LOC103592664 [Galeopterus variegatus]
MKAPPAARIPVRTLPRPGPHPRGSVLPASGALTRLERVRSAGPGEREVEPAAPSQWPLARVSAPPPPRSLRPALTPIAPPLDHKGQGGLKARGWRGSEASSVNCSRSFTGCPLCSRTQHWATVGSGFPSQEKCSAGARSSPAWENPEQCHPWVIGNLPELGTAPPLPLNGSRPEMPEELTSPESCHQAIMDEQKRINTPVSLPLGCDNSEVQALTPNVTIFGDKAIQEKHSKGQLRLPRRQPRGSKDWLIGGEGAGRGQAKPGDSACCSCPREPPPQPPPRSRARELIRANGRKQAGGRPGGGSAVTVKQHRKEIRQRLSLTESILEQLVRLCTGQEGDIPELEAGRDELVDVETGNTRAARGKALLADCYKPTEAFISGLLDKIRGMQKLNTPQKK